MFNTCGMLIMLSISRIDCYSIELCNHLRVKVTDNGVVFIVLYLKATIAASI